MLFKAVLGDLEWKTFFTAQPCWATFEISFPVIFVRKTQNHFLKVKWNPELRKGMEILAKLMFSFSMIVFNMMKLLVILLVPVHKKEDNLWENYSPISLLPIFSEIFEVVINKFPFNNFLSNKLFTTSQPGYLWQYLFNFCQQFMKFKLILTAVLLVMW